MTKSVIFYFSGTGNSLVVAKSIASKIENCQVVSMTGNGAHTLSGEFDRVGFVYPCYFSGIPNKVRDFISQLQFATKNTPYVFAVATYGGSPGNALSQVAALLQKKGISLNYAEKLKMYSNYVVLYGMSDKVQEKTNEAKNALKPILQNIVSKQPNEIKKSAKLLDWIYNIFASGAKTKDTHFHVSSTCNACGICVKVCPVKNIQLKDGKPTFQHHCEQCVACIQFCPQKAINYKKATVKRGRYTHPDVSVKEFITAMEQKEVE